MKLVCICDEESSIGFKISGIETIVVKNFSEAKELFKETISRKDVGIILVTKVISSLIKEDIEKQIYNYVFPLVIEIPSKTPEELITEKNEMAIINLDMGKHDFKVRNGIFSLFFENIPDRFEKGKDVVIKVEIDD